MATREQRAPSSARITEPTSRLQRQVQGFREFGFEHFLRMVSRYLPYWVFNFNHAVLFETQHVTVEPSSAPDIFVRIATESDADNASRLDISSEMFVHRLRRGDVGAVALQNRKLVCMNWAAVGKIYAPLTASILDTGPHGVYFYNLFTPDEERGKGHSKRIYRFQADLHKKAGRSTIFAGVETFNTISIQLHERFGFHKCGETISIVFLGITFCYYKSWPHTTPKLHVFLRYPRNLITA